MLANSLQRPNRKYAKCLGHVNCAAACVKEHQGRDRFLHGIRGGLVLSANSIFGYVLDRKLLPGYLLREFHNLQRAQCFRSTQLNDGIPCSRCIERCRRKFRDVLE